MSSSGSMLGRAWHDRVIGSMSFQLDIPSQISFGCAIVEKRVWTRRNLTEVFSAEAPYMQGHWIKSARASVYNPKFMVKERKPVYVNS